MAQSNHERVDRRWNKKSSMGNSWTSRKALKSLNNWLMEWTHTPERYCQIVVHISSHKLFGHCFRQS